MENIIRFFKKLINLNLVFMLILTTIIVPDVTYAKTLGDLKQELQKSINEYNAAQNDKKLTENQINNIKTNISNATQEIESSQEEIQNLTQEIEQLKNDIQSKKQQIKDIMSFYQISGSSTMYLDYAMGAKTFTDFIYRVAISEQLIEYNDSLVDEYNNMIVKNKEKQEKLSKDIKNLEQKQQELSKSLDSLGNQLDEIVDLSMDIEDEIASRREAIEMYEKQYGCKDTDDINVCTRGQLPADTKFWRPIISGGFSSEFGYRTYRLNGKTVTDFHSGLDLTGSTDVYASAAGIVAGIIWKSSCGGNRIYIHHKINGVTYTTSYVHLRSILVSVGDTVTKDTKIAIMGGDPSVETWDKCSTGRHLHFATAYGLYLTDYTSWNTYIAKSVNPRTLVNFPQRGTRFTNRTTKY